jgi:transposase InsO family protein/predicted aspartyl protease
LRKCDLSGLDLTTLLGGKHFLVSCTLSINGLGIQLRPLADTGANGYLFLNRTLALRLSKALGIRIENLPYSTPIRGYQGGIQSHVTQFIRLHLTIDGRRVYNCPFVILDLGNQDAIIGIKWMKRFRLGIDTVQQRFIWPPEYPPSPLYAKEILIPYDSRKLTLKHPGHQADVNKRDRAIEQNNRRGRDQQMVVQQLDAQSPTFSLASGLLPNIIRPYSQTSPSLTASPSRTEAPLANTYTPTPSHSTPCIVQIALISANAMHFHMQKKENEFFTTSLYEIDRILEDMPGRIPLDEDEETRQLIKELLPRFYTKFQDVFSKSESNRLPPHRSYDHKIHLESPLPNSFSPLYRQSSAELLATKQYLLDNLDKGFITHSKSPFASPILFVKKSDGGLRFCVDYRKLNALTPNDSYAIPRIDELLTRVSKAKIFTKLDIRQAFNRIRMNTDSEEYTTFRTRYGTYKSKVLPFGLCNGPATYQRYMNDVLMEYLDDFCMAYLDDILIYSEDPLDHHRQVKLVLARLRQAGLQVDIRKSEFDVTRTKYLGYILTTKGVETDPDKVAPLKNWARPTTITGVKSYLGFCGFYRQFIRNFGLIAKPLTTITRPSEPFIWTNACEAAFEELRRQLLSVQATYHFDPELPTKLETDASDGVIAGVLSQEHPDKNWYPVSFLSHVLVGHEVNWEIHDKELFAIIESFRKWRPEMMSVTTRILVYSDHRSLEYFMSTKLLTAKQVRWMEFLSDFNFEIKFTAGKDNQKADILSRREQDLRVQEAIKTDSRSRVLLGPARLDPRINADLAKAFVETQQTLAVFTMDSETRPTMIADSFELIESLKQTNRDSFSTLQERLPVGYSIQNRLLLYQNRLCVLRNTPLCTRLIKEAHEQPSSAHPGGTKTYQLLAPKYYWIGMGSDCKQYVKNCTACRQAHVDQTKQQGLLHPLPIPAYPMQHLCMDYKEFPRDRHGYDCILVFIDRLGKDSVTIPCHKTIDARGTAILFIQWVYRFGHTPESIVSDRGPQFVSSFWQEFCRIIGVKIKLSTAYHKQTDGQTEIMNRYIDQRLRPFVNYYQDNWSDLIPMIDRAQITLPHSSIGMAPYRLKFGVEPRTSWDWDAPTAATPQEKLNHEDAFKVATRMHNAWEVAKGNLGKAQERMSRNTNRHRRPIDWEVGDQVYLSTNNLKNLRPSRKLGPQWTGPFRIIEQVGHAYRLELPPGSKIHNVFSPDVLAKSPNTPLVGQENPKPSGEIIAGQEEWEVAEILAVKLVRGSLHYQVSWVGHDPDPTWYLASNFMGAPIKLSDFHEQRPTLPGPPRNLSEWLKEWKAGNENYDHLADNRPVLRKSPVAREELIHSAEAPPKP